MQRRGHVGNTVAVVFRQGEFNQVENLVTAYLISEPRVVPRLLDHLATDCGSNLLGTTAVGSLCPHSGRSERWWIRPDGAMSNRWGWLRRKLAHLSEILELNVGRLKLARLAVGDYWDLRPNSR